MFSISSSTPTVAIAGDADFGIRMVGAPLGHEVVSLIEAILLVSSGDSELSDQSRTLAAGVTAILVEHSQEDSAIVAVETLASLLSEPSMVKLFARLRIPFTENCPTVPIPAPMPGPDDSPTDCGGSTTPAARRPPKAPSTAQLGRKRIHWMSGSQSQCPM